MANRLHSRRSDRRVPEPDARRISSNGLQQPERIVHRDLWQLSTPVAAIRLTINALSSAGSKVTATILQEGIG
jgi:hypothetical protein